LMLLDAHKAEKLTVPLLTFCRLGIARELSIPYIMAKQPLPR
jgi:hypothetical protein